MIHYLHSFNFIDFSDEHEPIKNSVFTNLITESFDGTFSYEIAMNLDMNTVGFKDTIFNPFNYGDGHVFDFFSVGDIDTLEVPAFSLTDLEGPPEERLL